MWQKLNSFLAFFSDNLNLKCILSITPSQNFHHFYFLLIFVFIPIPSPFSLPPPPPPSTRREICITYTQVFYYFLSLPHLIHSILFTVLLFQSICNYKFNECIPENVLIIWVLTKYLLVNAQWIKSWFFGMQQFSFNPAPFNQFNKYLISVHLAFRAATTGYSSALQKVLRDTGWER